MLALPRLMSLLVLVLVGSVWAQVPTGRFELRAESGASSEGTLVLTRSGAGYDVERRVGRAEAWRGSGVVEDGVLTVRFGGPGLAAAVAGEETQGGARGVYRILDDGSLAGWVEGDGQRLAEVARIDTSRLSKRDYFAFLDEVPGFRRHAAEDAFTAFLELLVRDDVPTKLDRRYARKAGSVGAGRVLLALDYTRGSADEPSWGEALKAGPKKVLGGKILTPSLTHFRRIEGVPIFRGDGGFTAPFQDAHLTSESTNQVGHLLCAVETGVRAGRYQGRRMRRWAYERGLRVANRLLKLEGVEGSIADWSRAGIVGHEMIGDEDGSGFVGQMRAYGKLVGDGDPEGIRDAWDRGVAAVLAGDHLEAWRAARAIAAAGQIPETRADMEANRLDPAPRFARPGTARVGNTLADLALSIYGYALGLRAATDGYATPEAARADFEAFLAAAGSEAAEVEQAAEASRR
ncbi:MAG: hypothetical protein R3F62_27335 [Planctomycetota bacterium]